MARIPESEIERLKSGVSVECLVEASGIALKKAGKDFVGCCPFHEDDTASLVVTPSKNLWHCFGCGIGGGPIDWVIKRNGVSFRHAVELLREGLPSSSLAAEPGSVKRSTVRALPAPVAFDAGDQALLNQVVGYYHETLKQSPEALAYLKSRGLEHPELIERFKLGVADRSLGLRLPQKSRVAGADTREQQREVACQIFSNYCDSVGVALSADLDMLATMANNDLRSYSRSIRFAVGNALRADRDKLLTSDFALQASRRTGMGFL